MEIIGGAEEARTPDLQSAILALSQLSYCPISHKKRRVSVKESQFLEAPATLD